MLSNAIQFPTKSACELAELVGSVISMKPVVGKLTRIMTQHCQMKVAAAQDWDSKYPLDDYCPSEMVNAEEISDSSTHRELITMLYSLEAFGEKLLIPVLNGLQIINLLQRL